MNGGNARQDMSDEADAGRTSLATEGLRDDAMLIELAERLARTDPSSETRVYEPLRERLIAHSLAGAGQTQPEMSRRPRLALLSWAAVPLLLLAVMLGWPGALTAATRGIETFVQRLVLGNHTTVERHPSVTATPTLRPTPAEPIVIEHRGDDLLITTAIGSFSSPASLPGRPAGLQRYDDLGEARAASSYPLRSLADLPKGYAFREALVTPLYRTFLLYDRDEPRGEIILLQMPVGKQTGAIAAHSDSAEPLTAIVEMLTDQPVEETTFNGHSAAWVGQRSLMWEEDGVNYILGGTDLRIEDAIRLAKALR